MSKSPNNLQGSVICKHPASTEHAWMHYLVLGGVRDGDGDLERAGLLAVRRGGGGVVGGGCCVVAVVHAGASAGIVHLRS